MFYGRFIVSRGYIEIVLFFLNKKLIILGRLSNSNARGTTAFGHKTNLSLFWFPSY